MLALEMYRSVAKTALGKVAAGVIEAQGPRQIIFAVRRSLNHIRHRTENPH